MMIIRITPMNANKALKMKPIMPKHTLNNVLILSKDYALNLSQRGEDTHI